MRKSSASRSDTVYRESGTGDPVIFVHGIASTHATWGAVLAPLSQHLRCVAYDLRGHDASSLHDSELTVEALIQELEELRQTLHLQEIRLVGHSLGAFVALGYALKYPSRVRAIGLLAAPAARSDSERQAGAQLIEAMKAKGVRAVMPTLVANWYTPEFVRSRPEVLAARLAQIQSISDEVVIKSYELYYGTEITPWLGALTVPALVMTGEDARGCGAQVADFIASRLPNASLVILERQRNGILTEVPELVAAELLRFFRQH